LQGGHLGGELVHLGPAPPGGWQGIRRSGRCNRAGVGRWPHAKHFGQRALTITDKYLDYEISNSTAYDELNEIYDKLDRLVESDESEYNDFTIKLDVFDIQLALSGDRTSHESGREVLEARNELAEDIGESTRN